MPSFAADTAGIFRGPLAEPAAYTPSGGSAITLRVVPSRPDAVTDFGGGQFRSETAVFLVQVADVAAPAPGDRIELTETAEAFVVQGAPVRDRNRLFWRVDTRPA